MEAATTAEALAIALRRHGLTLAVAESLTCGTLASTVGAASEAATWFRGGVIAYMDDVKFSVLGVEPGPVVSEACARQMAEGVRTLLRADVGVAVTGVGGPGREEGEPPGTVFIALARTAWTTCEAHQLPGSPEEVLRATVEAAIRLAAADVAHG